MVKYNYKVLNNMYYVTEGRYPIGSNFYDSNNVIVYYYTSDGLVYASTGKVVNDIWDRGRIE